jgi:ABC-type uncharacterized transport system involved in gliding motility auxiliary subunit
MKRSILGGGTLIALAVLFVGLTVFFDHTLRGWRLDLTQNHLYTTAPGTDHILQSIKEPINLYFFYSQKTAAQIPQINTYGTRVREFLEEIASRSRGKVQLHVIDPAPSSEDEDRASELGVRGAPVGNIGTLYFGLAGTNSTDGKQAIEFFDPAKEQFLEYDVVKLIYQLSNAKKPVVAFLSGVPMASGFDPQSQQMREPWVAYTQAEQLFDIRPLEPGATKIDDDVNVLVLVHPKNLSAALQFAIDQYALRGGHILAFVDPVAGADTSGADPRNPVAAIQADKSSQLGPLLSAWGVSFNPKEVIGDRARALSVSTRQGEAPVQHLGILGLDQASINQNDVITSGLSTINIETGGYLAPVKGATTTFEPLLQSSTEAAPIPAERFAMLFDPSTLRDGFKPTGQRYTIGARITGNVKTAFPNGAPAATPPAAGAPATPPALTPTSNQTALKQSAKPLNLVIFADTDMLSDYLWVREQNFFGQRVANAFANNGDLFMNSLDNLAGSTDLISVRGRATFTRPFERVDALRRSADDRFRAKEQELEQELRSTEEKLTALQSKRNDKSSVILTPEQEKELDQFQEQKLRIRKDLRKVRADLNQDIQSLGTTVKVVNVFIVPLLFALAALAFWLTRRNERTPPPTRAPVSSASAAAGAKKEATP